MRIALIEWADTASYGNRWMEKQEALEKMTHGIVSIGLIIAEDSEQIKIIQSVSPCDWDTHNEIVIPKGCIKRIRYLRVK